MGCGCSFVKHPIERKRYVVDYSRWLDAPEILQGVSIVVSPATAPPLLAEATFVDDDLMTVVTYFSGGLSGTIYDAAFIISTDQGQIKRDLVAVQVQS